MTLEGPGDILVEQSLIFSRKASNNQANYEALLAEMTLAADLVVTNLKAQRTRVKYQLKRLLLATKYLVIRG